MKTNPQRKACADHIKWEHEKLDKLKKILDQMPIELLVQSFPEGVVSDWWGYYYQFTLPLRFELEEEFRQFCEYQGWRMEKIHRIIWDSKQSRDLASVYIPMDDGTEYQFQVNFDADKAGSTCVIREIGKEVKPVYEVVCANGAQEGSF